MLELGFKFTLAYLLGSVLGGLVIGFVRGGVDIRKGGSGNAGSTNAYRTHGALFALAVLVIDVGKGILAVVVIAPLTLPGIGLDPGVDRELVRLSVAFAAILGHVYPVWFDFKGGKGGATAAGLLCFLAPWTGAIIVAVWIAMVYFTGFVGLATISASVAAAILLAVLRLAQDPGLVGFAAAVAALIVYTHRSNIARMLKGTESRFGKRQRKA